MACKRTVLVIPDLHTPFHHPNALHFLRTMKRDFRPDLVVCVGDEVDNQAVSRYDSDPDAPSAGHELAQAVEELQPFYNLFPSVLVCRSNHTERLYKKAFSAGLPRAALRTINEILGAPVGWRWKDYWLLDGVRYMHGDGFSREGAALHAARQFRRSVVLGHLHTQGGVQYDATAGSTIWGLASGCLVDETQPAFAYKKHSARKAVLGCGVVAKGTPHFFPMK